MATKRGHCRILTRDREVRQKRKQGFNALRLRFAAQPETLQRGETLTRSVSEEIGCEPRLRFSVRTNRVGYNN